MDIFKKITAPDGTVMCTGSVILSVSYQEGKEDAALMLVWARKKEKKVKLSTYILENLLS